jgi:hypothetical protein
MKPMQGRGLVARLLAPEGGLLTSAVRPKLPVVLQYGIGWAAVYWSLVAGLTYATYSVFQLIAPSDDGEREKRKEIAEEDYVVVFDDKGRPAGYTYKPYAKAADKAIERTRRLRDGDL